MLGHHNAGLFADPGAGKTSVVLKARQILSAEKLIKRTLVVAPLRVCYEVWPFEVQDWIEFNDTKVTILHGPKKDKALLEKSDIYVINPEGLAWLFSNGRFEKLGIDMLVIDESSKFKYTKSKRFKILKPYLRKFRRRIILTGSPNPNGYIDLFGQIYILDLGKTLGQYITHYRVEYFNSTGFGGFTWVLQPGADKRIQRAIKPLVYRIDTSEYIEMPTVVPNIIRVSLPPKARKIYDELEEDLLTTLEGGHNVTAVSAGAASNKCCQVANGGLYYEENNCTHKCQAYSSGGCTCEFEGYIKEYDLKKRASAVHDAKTEALIDLVDELQGAPLLVAYEFKHDLERIQAALGKPKSTLPYIGGGVSPKRTAEIVQAWNHGQISVLLVHPAAMAHGLNLQKSNCRHVCWYGITWDYELYDQLIRRVRRPGNKSADVFCHHIVARDTVDEAKMRALKFKQKTQNGLLDALLSYARGRRKKR